jgi:hypothetical protein
MEPATGNGRPMIRKRCIKYFYRLQLAWVFLMIVGSGVELRAADTSAYSTKEQALAFLFQNNAIRSSVHWPNIKPDAFLENLKLNVRNPLSIYEGRGTNFCSYAALSYIPLNKDPLHYVKFMLLLYKEGSASLGSVNFRPSAAVKKAAGTLRFKGKLDARPSEQMWFLVLADHFKGYLNFFNHNYQPGDEDGFWASTNYAKFNRMVRKLFNYHVTTTGSDLIRTGKKNIAAYVGNKTDSGVVFLYVNNTYLTRKTHGINKGLPTHFIVVINIAEVDGVVTLTYWDYGGKTLQQVSPAFLKKITFGVSYCTPKTKNEQ